MKFRISKEAFLDGLQKTQHVVANRTTLPILSNVLIQASGDRLTLTTTDLDMGISVSVMANVEKEGTTTLPVRRLLSIVRELSSEMVDVAVDAKSVAEITSGPSYFRINGLPHEEFPPMPELKDAKDYHIPQLALRDGLRMTQYAISSDETRYVLNGIFVSFRDGRMTLVATDGRRLAMSESDLEFPASHEADAIVPSKAVSELLRLLGGDGEVVMRLVHNRVRFSIGDCILVTKLIEGNYPNYRQVIPGDTNERVELPRLMMLDALNRVNQLCVSNISVKLLFADNKVEITLDSPEVGEAREEILIKYQSKPLRVAFNPDYLMAPMKHLQTDTVYLDLIDESSPGVIRIDGSFLYVLMPMRA